MATKKTTTAASSGLQAALSELRNKQGLEIGSFDGFGMTPKGLTTGNIALDALTGIGGFPEGRITELVGPPSSGKTTSALQAAAQCQQNGGVVFFADFERSLDPIYCAALGLDVHAETFLYMQPKHFQQGANAFRKLVRTGEISMGIFDSVATMVTEHELEADTGAVQVADRAKMMHQFLRQLNPELAEYKTAAIFLNHLMELVDATPMGRQLAARGIKRKTSPGGTALPFYASLRVEFKQIGNVQSEEVDLLTNEEVKMVRQTKVEAVAIKNKVADPFRKVALRVRFGRGFSQPYSVLNLLAAHKVVKVSGSWYTFPEPLRQDPDVPKMQGEDAILKAVEDDPEWFARLEAAAYRVIEQLGADALEQVDGTDFTESEKAEAEALTNSTNGGNLTLPTDPNFNPLTGEIVED